MAMPREDFRVEDDKGSHDLDDQSRVGPTDLTRNLLASIRKW